MAGKGKESPTPLGPKGSARVANVLDKLKATGNVPGYAPEQVGAETHKTDEPGVIWVEVDHILDSPYQHGELIDQAEFQALVESIQKEGFLAALNVNEHPKRAGYYILTAGGHQRRNAAKAAGKAKIPVFVEPALDPIRLAFRAAKENAVQVNRNPVNLGYLFLQIQDEFSLTQEEIAEELGKDRNFVKTCITAAKSDPDIQELLTKKPDSLRAMTYLRRLDTPEDRAPIIVRLLSGESTTDGVKAEVEAILQQRQSKDSVLQGSTAEGVAERNGRIEAPQQEVPDVADSSLAAGATGRADNGRDGAGPQRLALPPRGPSGGHSLLEEQLGDPAAVQGTGAEEDPGVYERLGKLRDIVSRLEAYKRMRGQRTLAPKEKDALAQLGSLVKALLGE